MTSRPYRIVAWDGQKCDRLARFLTAASTSLFHRLKMALVLAVHRVSCPEIPMSRDAFPESDWKKFRVVRERALERFCERVLANAGACIQSPGETAHERYLRLFKLLREEDKDLAFMFDYLSRSKAWLQLVAMYVRKLVTEDEFAQFSEPTRESIRSSIESWKKVNQE